jgi:PAS domain S-box-containing protein
MTEKSILIAENEVIVANDLSRKLERLGYSVSAIVSTGKEAIAEAHRLQPILVLMDIQLTGEMDGIEAAGEIKKCCDLPVIFLTAHSDKASLSRAKLTEPFGFILKPFDERDLATQIELAISKHQSEKIIREHREWLQITLSSIGDAVIATDVRERITFINPVAESLTGWSAAEATNMTAAEVFRIIDEQTGQRIHPPINPSIERGLERNETQPIPTYVTLLTKTERKVPVEHRASPIRNATGHTVGMVFTFRDVTEKREAEEALRHSQYLLNKAQEMARLGSWEHDVDSGEIRWSDEVFRIFGLAPGVFAPTYEKFMAMVHPDDRPMVDEAYSSSLCADCNTYDIEHRIVRADGEIRFVREKCEHLRDHTGRVIRSVGMAHDITSQKQAQEALERSNRELEQFAYVASHDLQEPLRAVIGFLQLLQSHYEDKIEKKGLQFIDRSIKAAYRMQSLIRDLLNLSRVSSRPANFVLTDLNAIVEEAVDGLHSLVKSRNPSISWTKLPNLPVDANQIRSLFQNLIINGMNYNVNPVPTVEIGCRKVGRDYHFFVKDNGIGIAPKFHKRIFVVFQRLHTEREYLGTGMGLALCKKIVEQHGGTIWVESEIGAGSTFHFTLPLSR